MVLRRLHDNRLTRPLKRSLVRSLVARLSTRRTLNGYYRLLDDRARADFHQLYAKIFRGVESPSQPSEWIVPFCGRNIRLPLRPSSFWLDWDSAVSIVGHDIEIKQTYAGLIGSEERPDLFLDVGANYGTHSVLFLSAGIPTIAFEPNPRCHEAFDSMCALNGLSGQWEPVAVGAAEGEVELTYPETDTWLGSVSATVSRDLKANGTVISQQVKMKTLDGYLDQIPVGKTVLIKIDVEGFECEVIKGATNVLRAFRPTILFESNDTGSRDELYSLLDLRGYAIQHLPWRPSAPFNLIGSHEFSNSPATNFIARPLRSS
jgi:FkbM family methyltransferase